MQLDSVLKDTPDADVAALLARVARLRSIPCAQCARPLCGHQAIFSIALGFADAPLCIACLAHGLGWPMATLRNHLSQHVEHRICYKAAWQQENQYEGFAVDQQLPPCLDLSTSVQPIDVGDRDRTITPRLGAPSTGSGPPERESTGTTAQATSPSDAHWDAGDLGCGDLVLSLRMRLKALPPRTEFRLRATDPGAREDIPAWCRLTGHRLLEARPPEFLIERKDD